MSVMFDYGNRADNTSPDAGSFGGHVSRYVRRLDHVI
jgi:hypothetical protein